MIKKNGLILGIVVSLMLMSFSIFSSEPTQAKVKNYSISATTKPINKTYAKSKNYNSSTKHYYLIRSYLEQIEKNGGGTLQLKKGTYTISNVLYIPSNTTLKLDNGVVIKKGTSSGKASFAAAKSLFQLVETKKSKKSIGKYDGAKNIKIIGSGNATIDMNNASKAHGIIIGHAQKISISGIQFKRNNAGSFIHIIASKDVKIDNNEFIQAKSTTKLPAIRLESAIKSSSVYAMKWNKLDGTINSKVAITKNIFEGQYTGIKTSTYAKGKYQNSITISGNEFANTRDASIYMTAWNKPQIVKNEFDDREALATETILARATKFPTIKDNHFINASKIILFTKITINDKASISAVETPTKSTYQNEMNLTNKRELTLNKVTNLQDYRIDLPSGNYGNTGNKLELYNEKDIEKDVYMFNSSSESLNQSYTLRPSYTKLTKDYYVLRSIMEQLEIQGGGTLFIEKGDYSITNTLYVPSNVTIELEGGTILRKAIVTDAPTMNLSSSIFQLVPPSKSTGKATVSKYNGTKNVKIFSKGRAILDLKYKFFSFAIIMAHAENIQIENLDFINMNSGHFIELNSSKNVDVFNSTFKDSVPSEGLMKEAINIDTPDIATKGFNLSWSNLDRTPTEDVSIQNSTFENLDRAIGTHKYSGSGMIKGITYKSMPHKNVKIINNSFRDIRNDAIRIMNWDRPRILNNRFYNIGLGDIGKRGILASGVNLPTFKNNYFEDTGRAMQFFPWKNNLNGEDYEIIYNTIDQEGLKALSQNSGRNMNEYFIRISEKYLVYTKPQKVNISKK